MVSTTLGGRVEVDRLSLSADLFAEGMTWPQTVQVMLSLEDEFDVVFPVDTVVRATFADLRSIIDAVVELSDRQAVVRTRTRSARFRR